jgi:hypothetical protein
MILPCFLLTRREHTLVLPLSICTIFSASLCLIQHSYEHQIVCLFYYVYMQTNTTSLPSFIPRGINVTACMTQILLVSYLPTIRLRL